MATARSPTTSGDGFSQQIFVVSTSDVDDDVSVGFRAFDRTIGRSISDSLHFQQLTWVPHFPIGLESWYPTPQGSSLIEIDLLPSGTGSGRKFNSVHVGCVSCSCLL
ncbi:hypothetical protein M6B38_101175 [Iris pallida]|uniref:Uncharacterized protein n=1 Tax=Iris pallida TaxID=29817 RepID=A0AAX6ILM3_IRIPA|nr:hypothetical protein M6B38_101175 [Iris pallida]